MKLASVPVLLRELGKATASLGLDMHPERREAVVTDLLPWRMTEGEAEETFYLLRTDPEISRQIRIFGTIIPADVRLAWEHCIRRKQHRRVLGPDLSGVPVASVGRLQEGYRHIRMLLLTPQAEGGVEPFEVCVEPKLKYTPARYPVEPVGRCPRHPERERYADGFCAACEIERVRLQKAEAL